MNAPKLNPLKFAMSIFSSSWRYCAINQCTRGFLCLKKTHVRVFFESSFFRVLFVAKRYILQQKCLNGQNRNMPARNTLVKLLALYTDLESHNAQRHRQTDRRQDDANSRSYCVTVQSAKKYDRLDVILTVSAIAADRGLLVYHVLAETRKKLCKQSINSATTFCMHSLLTWTGWLKMQDVKMTDHQNCRAWNCRTWK